MQMPHSTFSIERAACSEQGRSEAEDGVGIASDCAVFLGMQAFKLLHGFHQGFHTFDGHGVVGRCAEAAHIAVSLDAMHATGSGKLTKFVFKFFLVIGHDEANVHETAVLLVGHSATEEGVAVDFVVQQFGALFGQFFHGRHTSLCLNPT